MPCENSLHENMTQNKIELGAQEIKCGAQVIYVNDA